MSEFEIGSLLTAIVDCNKVKDFLMSGFIIKCLKVLLAKMPDYYFSKIAPKYVVVQCSNFGTGLQGWRLREVDKYCFANNYFKAKTIVESWNKYGKLSFMIKYENWLNKGGENYKDGIQFDVVSHYGSKIKGEYKGDVVVADKSAGYDSAPAQSKENQPRKMIKLVKASVEDMAYFGTLKNRAHK
jgi:hypothetical protein